MKVILIIALYLFSGHVFCQDSSAFPVSKDKAIAIAGKHGIWSRRVVGEHVSSVSKSARLDTVNKRWVVTYSKLSFRGWGRANRAGDPERRSLCRRTNGCYAIREKIREIDATTGKVIRKRKTKKVAGSYE